MLMELVDVMTDILSFPAGNTTGKKAVYDTFALNLNKAQGKWKRVGRLKEPLIYPGIIQHSSSL